MMFSLEAALAAKVYVIAEAGVNHNGDPRLARKLIDAAVDARADAVKFQTFRAASVAAMHAPLAGYQAVGSNTTMAKMLENLELGFDEFAQLKLYCDEAGIEFLSTAFDVESAEFLFQIGMRIFKIPSGEITNPRLVRTIGSFGRPVILSTGMSTVDEIERALGWLELSGASDIALLHCVSEYPAPASSANLRSIDTLSHKFGRTVGWSDHTLRDEVTLAAVARGARIIEKHLSLDTSMEGPDHKASLNPLAFSQMVERIRSVEKSLGSSEKRPTPDEMVMRSVARRSIVAARSLPAGTVLREIDLDLLRPGTGIPAELLDSIVGRRLRNGLTNGQLLEMDDLD